LEAYANGNDLAWAARLVEFYNPDRIVPGRKTLMAAFREEQELLARDAIVGKLVVSISNRSSRSQQLTFLQSLISDLGLDSGSKTFVKQLCDGPMHSEPLTDHNDLTSTDKIALSTGGCVCLVAYWVFSATVFGATTHPRPVMHIFPEHFAVLDKFLQDDAHSQIQKSVGTIEALIAIGLWLQSNKLISVEPTSPLTNSSASEDPTSDFMRYIHLTTLIALYHPHIQARNAASALAGLVLHSDPSDDDRLRILYDLLENCMFASLKARAVAWLKEELIASSTAKQQNLFSTPQALEEVQYVVFPSLDSICDLPSLDLVQYLTANVPFLMQAVNFALFLWGSDSEVENRWRHVLPGNMEATVRERWFQPLREMLDRVERERKSVELGMGEEGEELGMVEGE
jgi:hypothetical protein